MIKVGYAEGTCPVCGRVWRRRRPATDAVCDCYLYCQICGEKMQPYTPDLNPAAYRSEDSTDPTGEADRHEATMYTRYYCPTCDEYSDGVPVVVRLR